MDESRLVDLSLLSISQPQDRKVASGLEAEESKDLKLPPVAVVDH